MGIMYTGNNEQRQIGYRDTTRIAFRILLQRPRWEVEVFASSAPLRELLLSVLDFLSFGSWTIPSARQKVGGRGIPIQRLRKK